MPENSEELERRVEFVEKTAGKDTVDILEKAGLDVNAALRSILSKKISEEKALEEKRKDWSRGKVERNCMTSELIYLMDTNNPECGFKKELERRLDLLNLADEQRTTFIQSDYSIMQERTPKPPISRWVGRYYITPGVTTATLLKPEQYTLSELLAIFDDADAARVRDHRWLPEETMKAVWYVLAGNENKSPYYAEFDSRVRNWSWNENQSNSYVKNECMLLARLKWGYHSNPEWIEETVVKK